MSASEIVQRIDTLLAACAAHPTAIRGSIHLHCTDELPEGAGEWLIVGDGSSLSVEHLHAKGDVALRAPASVIAAMLTGEHEVPADGAPGVGEPAGCGVQIFGDRALLASLAAAVSAAARPTSGGAAAEG